MNWLYEGKEITELEDFPENTFGFVYQITHLPTGKKYIGKKQLVYTQKKRIGKKERKRIKEEKKLRGERAISPTFKYVKKESDWKSYVGSNDEIKQLLEEGSISDFKREILEFAHNKKQLSYLETKKLFTESVLEKAEFLNSNIQGKWYPKDTK
jgi:serine/threonine protein kinase